ncbi:MAG: hypothetical protein AAF716_01975 [Cyanobacteria bacterium P01_D01_bin.1]
MPTRIAQNRILIVVSTIIPHRPGIIQSLTGLVQSHPGITQSSTALYQSHPGIVQSLTGLVQSHPGITQSLTGLVQSHSASIPLHISAIPTDSHLTDHKNQPIFNSYGRDAYHAPSSELT